MSLQIYFVFCCIFLFYWNDQSLLKDQSHIFITLIVSSSAITPVIVDAILPQIPFFFFYSKRNIAFCHSAFSVAKIIDLKIYFNSSFSFVPFFKLRKHLSSDKGHLMRKKLFGIVYTWFIHIDPTPPLGQDMTQGQFLSGV